ncbi:winged helix DNA-binding domain-containing protein [Demetria terragena]|uniref:winged helix DNA-binding domain-containing protein n=1 Tax=Demetria terragena TaxID=63959 RepID=UPI000477033E|nr:winged helix DNA-binding domain-containing protein [Demetria terragena]
MTTRPHISDEQRRTRLARRHALAPAHRVADALAATRAMTVLHATEAASVHLAVAARVDGCTLADIDTALYRDRSLVKQLAMRRTLFVFPRDLLPAAWGSASARVAQAEGRRVAKAVERAGISDHGDRWFTETRSRVAELLANAPGGLATKEIRALVPELDVRVNTNPNSTSAWAQPVQIAPWALTQLGLEARAVRGLPDGQWRNPRARWTDMATWLGEAPTPEDAQTGYARLIERYLRTFGPATEVDIVWWLGSTKSAVRTALATLEAVEVGLDGGGTGYVLPDDLDLDEEVEPWAALAPTLDPTLMGWKEREFYLDPKDRPYLFDTNGNGGTTAWWNGRVVGCWVQDKDGSVRPVLREEVGRAGEAALAVEAERLTDFMEGAIVSSVYASAMQRGAILP